ncbi:MAG: translation initiation factor IF-2 [Candidatus Nanoclepta minutus]|uniref:Probable translation initiation factor IF-2 n=1 Tax=Candidatus Nanoclepta minutus TaxID=1940235 RepID=A0A397WRQ3_9ARCH|nr:MAG: translation initiation factor IF-2 [Candidatus Nanoclepta minutus]
MAIRSPIVVVLGHVDSGKTSLLDSIRQTSLTEKEAGGITQHIGATEVPIEVVEKVSKPLMGLFNFRLNIPSILFIDTPGHEAFSNLRKRGGSIADFAIIVVDVIEGIQKQTIESIEICKQFKVPFLIALNKIDRIDGWKPQNTYVFLDSIKKQGQRTAEELEKRLYDVVYKLYELGFESERFDRVKDFRREVAIIPVSAKTKEGLAELLLIISGLVQRFLEERLKIDVEGPGKGVILERKEVKGLGDVIDVILYDGKIKKGDRIAFLTREGVKITNVKAIYKPEALKDIRFKTKFYEVEEATAACGVRISGEGLEEAIPGSHIYVITSEEELSKIKSEIEREVSEIIFSTDRIGVVAKADTLGTLEVLIKILKENNIPVARSDIGDITKEDIMFAYSVKEKKPEYGIIIGFNVKVDKNAEDFLKSYNIRVILGNVVYRMIEDIQNYVNELTKKKLPSDLPSVAKIRILPGNVFRRSSPAIVGVEVLAGELRKDVYLMREDGKVIGKVLSIQYEKKNLDNARKGDKVAVSIDDAVVGRNVEEGNILYTFLLEDQFRKYKEYKDMLSEEQKEVLREIANIMRKTNPAWGL